MPDHIHVLITVNEESNLAAFLKPWKKTSSYRIKRFYVEHLTEYQVHCPDDSPIWQAKYYNHPLEADEKVNEKIEYMHQNLVSAGLVRSSLDWKWSSARFYEKGEATGVAITPVR